MYLTYICSSFRTIFIKIKYHANDLKLYMAAGSYTLELCQIFVNNKISLYFVDENAFFKFIFMTCYKLCTYIMYNNSNVIL